MSVVTVSRTVGSGGDYIGRRLAEELGYIYIDKDRIADIIKEYGIIRLDDIYNSVSHLWDRLDEYKRTTVEFLTAAVIAVAQQGNVVIAGRGSYGILSGFGNVYHVRIQAPFELRALAESRRLGIGIEDAAKAVKEDDRLRRKFIESNFYFAPDNVELFDVVLDTSAVEPDECVKILADICGAEKVMRKDASLSLSEHKTDPVLTKHIKAKMKEYA